MNVKQLLVMLIICISLLPSFSLASVETYGEVVELRKTPLRVRVGPGIDYEKIGELQLGRVLKIVHYHGSWYEIEYDNGLIGFSFAKHIRILHKHEYNGYAKVVAHQWLNVRSGPSHEHFRKIYRAAKHSILRTLGEVQLNQNSSWLKVQDKNGAVGYVNGNSKYVMPLYEDYYELSAFKSFDNEPPAQTLKIQSHSQSQEFSEDEFSEDEFSEDEMKLDKCLKNIKRKKKSCHLVCSRNSDTSEELQECKFECNEVFKDRRLECFAEYKDYEGSVH